DDPGQPDAAGLPAVPPGDPHSHGGVLRRRRQDDVTEGGRVHRGADPGRHAGGVRSFQPCAVLRGAGRLQRRARRIHGDADVSALTVVSYRPDPSEFAWTFGGVPPRRRIEPGSVLELWTEDAFGGKVQGPD